jgi:hypothetical protein
MDGSLMVGKGDTLSFEEMRDEERMIVQALEHAHRMGIEMVCISDLQEVAGWNKAAPHQCAGEGCTVCDEAIYRGNSKVRNNLRRLMKYGVIKRPVDGAYALVAEPKPIAPITPGSPRELNDEENAIIRRIRTTEDERVYKVALKMIEPIKRGDCSFYSACLDQAISGKWEGFSCASCSMYTLPDQDQRVSDMLALRALQTASDQLDEHGKVLRIRGVKPGADAKRTPSHLADSKTID